MRKLHVVAVAAVAVAAVAAAPAGAKAKRIQEAPYQHSAGIYLPAPTGEAGVAMTCVADVGGGCVHIDVPAGATSVSIEIADEGGGDVVAIVSAGDGAEVCSATDQPLRLNGETSVSVIVLTGTCSDGTVSLPTSGTVTATFV